jgi:hypothetical protein
LPAIVFGIMLGRGQPTPHELIRKGEIRNLRLALGNSDWQPAEAPLVEENDTA